MLNVGRGFTDTLKKAAMLLIFHSCKLGNL